MCTDLKPGTDFKTFTFNKVCTDFKAGTYLKVFTYLKAGRNFKDGINFKVGTTNFIETVDGVTSDIFYERRCDDQINMVLR